MAQVMAPANDYMKMNDAEHAWLDSACEEMSALISRPDYNKMAAIDAITKLKAAMLLHYAEEEGIMKKVGYPHMGSHKRSHDYFLTKVSSFIMNLSGESADLSGDDWAEMVRLLDNHVRLHDHNLAEFLSTSHGTKPT